MFTALFGQGMGYVMPDVCETGSEPLTGPSSPSPSPQLASPWPVADWELSALKLIQSPLTLEWATHSLAEAMGAQDSAFPSFPMWAPKSCPLHLHSLLFD